MTEKEEEEYLGDTLHVKCAKIENGDIVCPYCKVHIVTPVGINPNTHKQEKMIVVPWALGTCKLCKKQYSVTAKQALIHNNYWFPEDRKYQC